MSGRGFKGTGVRREEGRGGKRRGEMSGGRVRGEEKYSWNNKEDGKHK